MSRRTSFSVWIQKYGLGKLVALTCRPVLFGVCKASWWKASGVEELCVCLLGLVRDGMRWMIYAQCIMVTTRETSHIILLL